MIIISTIKGFIERITFKNEENGFCIIKLNSEKYKELITVIGYINSIAVGETLEISGEWITDKKYGTQFKAISYQEIIPDSIEAIKKYLGSGLIKGIGPASAKNIVDIFKEDTLKIIENEPNKLLQVVGIGKKTVERIKKSWLEHKEIKDLTIFLQDFNIGISYIQKIFKAYEDKSIEIIKENPYKLSEDIWGIGFKTADKIAEKLGIDKESYIRCRSGIFHTLNELASEGHCYANFDQLINKAVELLDIDNVKLTITVDEMCFKKELISENMKKDKIYLPYLFYSEVGVSKLIKEILKEQRQKDIKDFSLNEAINYDDIQKNSINYAVNSKFMVLTGGPGTGKTTTMSGIIEIFKNNNFKILLAAPTGRAAKRMSEATGIEAKTIHRLLEANPSNGYNKNEKNLLDGDVLIVDESSMIDIILMYNLLKAVPKHMSIILIGDMDQLPSVGAGNVFKDIIESGIIPVVKLEKIYRQAKNSDIIKNAHKVNKGDFLNLINSKNSDFFFIEEDDCKIPYKIAELCKKRLPEKYKVNPINDIQILSPMRKSDTGTINLNFILQNTLNQNTLLIKYGNTEFRLNDKVMQIKNNYNKEIFNGDIGIISSVDLENNTIKVNFDGKIVEYEQSELDELVLSYAITIHKSQGSEYPIVIIPITMSHFIMLQRNLLYTGITRAKKILILIGSKKAISYSIKNNKVNERNTWLSERLKNNI